MIPNKIHQVSTGTPTTSCPECRSSTLVRDYETAELVCKGCGFVIAEKMTDKGPEWRAFTQEQREKRSRVGSPLTYMIHDKGLSTTIGKRYRDAYGRSLRPERRAQIFRMQKWQRRCRVANSVERNLASALTYLAKFCSSLNLPKGVLETASVLYRCAVKKGLIRGRKTQSVVAASIYMACRKCGIARTLAEVAKTSRENKREVWRSYRMMVKELKEFVPPLSPSHYVSRLANQLELYQGAETVARHILRVVKQAHLTSGKAPISLAAATTYLASIMVNDRRTQREIAENLGITEVTLRNRYRDFIKNLNITVKL